MARNNGGIILGIFDFWDSSEYISCARQQKGFRKSLKTTKKNHKSAMTILNLPNILTLSRALLIPVIIAGVYSLRVPMLILSISLLILIWVLDYFDGFIARKRNLVTLFGTFIDPIVDKMTVLSLFFVFSDLGLIPLWLPLLLLFREFLTSGIRQVSSLKGEVLGVNWMGKIKWNLQIILIIYTLFFLLGRNLGQTFAYGEETIYFGTMIIVLSSLVSSFVFLYWNRKLFLDGK
jgi:CDP-diacylglycerol--glycerol-3-phosphate 3-phosphatidyltransferase